MSDRSFNRGRRMRDFGRGQEDYPRRRTGEDDLDWGRGARRSLNRGYGVEQNQTTGGPYDWEYGDRTRQSYGFGSRQDADEYLDYEWGGGYGGNWDYDREEEMVTRELGDADWTIPGPYTGMGPSNYRRTDERILEDVNEMLTQHGRIDARRVNVQVQNGEVTLTGSVFSRQARRMVEDALEFIPGVRDVQNQLRVEETGRYSRWQQPGSEQQWGHTQEHRLSEPQPHSPQPHSQQPTQAQTQTQTQAQTRAQQAGYGGSVGIASQLRPGMDVEGSDGDFVGQVKELRNNDFLLDRPLARDVYVPFTACSVQAGKVRLNVKSTEVADQDWPVPDILNSGE